MISTRSQYTEPIDINTGGGEEQNHQVPLYDHLSEYFHRPASLQT